MDGSTTPEPINPAAEWVSIDSLVGWADNPRKNADAIGPVAASIARFGFAAPILARLQNREIIAGHTRWEAAKQLGLAEVPVRWLDLSETEARALALADNRLGELADWDDAKLSEILRELSAAEVPIDDLGWADEELARLVGTTVGEHQRGPPGPPAPAAPGAATIRLGDCREVMREYPDATFDSVVCDPPYGLSEAPSVEEVHEILSCWMAGNPYDGRSKGFMGREWDAFVPGPEVWREVFRVLKPGGHLVAFGGTRTIDWLMLALRMAGFEVRDLGEWQYANGFPKSLDVSRAIVDGAGERRGDRRADGPFGGNVNIGGGVRIVDRGTPVTEEAQRWAGWGTALKPAVEPWVLARRPFDGTIAECVAKHGVGGLNIDVCRFAPGDPMNIGPNGTVPSVAGEGRSTGSESGAGAQVYGNRELVDFDGHPLGRWPANLVHCAKPSRAEREAGCGHLPVTDGAAAVGRKPGSKGLKHARAGASRTIRSPGADDGGHIGVGVRNAHPTLKPIRLMAWLVRLVTPPGGRCLDPFMGSGTVGCAAVPQGFRYDGIEIAPEYHRISEARIAHWSHVGIADMVGPSPVVEDPDPDSAIVVDGDGHIR